MRVAGGAIALALRPDDGLSPASATPAVTHRRSGDIAFMQLTDEEQQNIQLGSLFASQSAASIANEGLGADVARPNWSWLEIQPGMARYADLSFVAEGESRNFVLQPIATLKDESYSSYFNISLPVE